MISQSTSRRLTQPLKHYSIEKVIGRLCSIWSTDSDNETVTCRENAPGTCVVLVVDHHICTNPHHTHTVAP
jgi:hypothetical protein